MIRSFGLYRIANASAIGASTKRSRRQCDLVRSNVSSITKHYHRQAGNNTSLTKRREVGKLLNRSVCRKRSSRLKQCVSSSRKKSTNISFEHSGSSGKTFQELERFAKSLSSLKPALYTTLLKPRTVPLPRWISSNSIKITLSEVFGHGAFILVATSYAVDDFVMLRAIAVLGSSSMLVFTYFHPHGRVLWLPFRWNALFILLNSYWIAKYIADEYLARYLSEDLLQLQEDHFSAMSLVDFAKLFNCGEVENFREGEQVLAQSENNQYVRVVLSGNLDCKRDNMGYQIGRGHFISEAGLHAGLDLEGSVESSVMVEAKSDCKCIRWDRTKLKKLLSNNTSLASSLQSIISWDIVSKLKKQRQYLISRKTENPREWTIKRTEQNGFRYKSILKNLLSSHGHRKYKKQVENYRLIHDINDEQHLETLKELGWTVEEYELGYKQVFEDENEIWHGVLGKW